MYKLGLLATFRTFPGPSGSLDICYHFIDPVATLFYKCPDHRETLEICYKIPGHTGTLKICCEEHIKTEFLLLIPSPYGNSNLCYEIPGRTETLDFSY